ncbi:MAG: hypothetical protein HY525_16860 [Betaproteobacteria bacterium]|nr:hypothetical protein [Betaproteobacteria bacterium]
MSKLFAAIFAATFALGTVSAFAGDAPKKGAAKVDCKAEKNKDHKDCVKAAAPAKK